jgi:hypothetical protein
MLVIEMVVAKLSQLTASLKMHCNSVVKDG